MAISTVGKYEFDIVTQATTLKIPPNVLKLIIQKLFNMSTWRLIPDTIYFIESTKVYAPESAGAKGGNLAVDLTGPLLINGEDNIVIGLRAGQGTDVATTLAYICKAAKTVFDLTPWYATMDAKLK